MGAQQEAGKRKNLWEDIVSMSMEVSRNFHDPAPCNFKSIVDKFAATETSGLQDS
jgi:hypothetical protein